MKHDIPIAGGIESFADPRESKHIRLRPGVRHYAKTKFARRARKAVRLSLVEPYPGYAIEAEEFLAHMAATGAVA